MNMSALLLCGHGSRDPAANAEFLAVAEAVDRAVTEVPVAPAFLELAEPLLWDGLVRLYQAGHRRIAVVPGLLFAAGHAKADIPEVLDRFRADHPEATVTYGRELGPAPGMIQAAAGRIAEAGAGLADSPAVGLVMVGRGSSDPEALAVFRSLAATVADIAGVAGHEVGFCQVAEPDVATALDRAAARWPAVVVMPYLLFRGFLVDRVGRWVDAARDRHGDVRFVTAPHLADHPGVVATFTERAREALA